MLKPKPPPPRIFRTGGERRAEIVAAAFACLQEVGYAKLTARKIAERLGISLGHLTYHFRDMQEILVETYRYASMLLLEGTERELSRRSRTPADQLRAYLEAGFSAAFLKHDYLRVRIDLWSAARMSADLAAVERELYERYRQKLVALVEATILDSGLAADRVTILVDTIMATLDGLWLDWARRGDAAAVKNGLDGSMFLVQAAIRLQAPLSV